VWTDTRRSTMVTIGAAGFLMLGIVCGIAADRAMADRRRDAVLEPYQDALRERNRHVMAVALRTHGRHEVFQRAWAAQLARIDEAVFVGDARGAVAAWRDAYSAAMRSGRWRDLVEVGAAAVRVGDVPEFRETPYAAARRSYLTALLRAQAERSVDGVLRVAEGFEELGDRLVVEHCLAMAYTMAEGHPEARAEVVTFATRVLSAQPSAVPASLR
jgi:hypothetical protein